MSGRSSQPPSFATSKTDLCPEQITFTEKGKPWRGRTTLEKCLVLFVLIFFIVAVVFLALFLVYYLKEDDDKDLASESCKTMDCLETASYMGQSLDQAVDPCEDFYQFACGRWIDRHPTTPTHSVINNFVLANVELHKNMRDLLEAKDPTALDAFQKVRAFYSSCLNTLAIDSKGTAPLLNLLKTNGSNLFPTLEPNWVDENMNLNQILDRVGRVGSLGFSPFISATITTDVKQSTQNIIAFSQPTLGLPSRSSYLGPRNSPVLLLYQKLYVDLMTLLGADRVTSLKDAVEMVDLEIQIAKASMSKDQILDSDNLYNNMTLRHLSERYPQFNWLEYLQGHFSLVGINITMDEVVVVYTLPYFDKIFDILNSTSTRAVLNHCLWTFVNKFSTALDNKFRDTKAKFSQSLTGASRSPERWSECFDTTDKLFKEVSGRLYVEHHFPSTAKAKMDTMVDNLKEAFREMILEIDWMASQTKTAALEKLDAVVDMVGYPKAIMNDTALNAKTKHLNISEGEFFANILNIRQNYRLRILRTLRQPVNSQGWLFSAATVNAFYQPSTNSIFFPAAVLQKPLFSDKFLDALNYGGIGFTIGHELTHGFDTTGSQFDKIGTLRQWWQEEDLQKFQNRTQCMIEQYNNFLEPVLNKSMNGRLTLAENIADNGGVKEAYRAYRKLIARRQKEEPRLPALDYTPDQLFFISAAQSWCANLNTKMRELYLQLDNHSPFRFRVIGPLQNSEDFARVFQCKVGSYMNPEKKCHVW